MIAKLSFSELLVGLIVLLSMLMGIGLIVWGSIVDNHKAVAPGFELITMGLIVNVVYESGRLIARPAPAMSQTESPRGL